MRRMEVRASLFLRSGEGPSDMEEMCVDLGPLHVMGMDIVLSFLNSLGISK